MEFRILDLFCGAGGFSCGLDSINEFKTVIGVDFNKQALETFDFNLHPNMTIYGDITQQDIKSNIINAAKKYNVNMIIGGPPCQGFSQKGKKLGLNDPRNFLFKEYLNIVKEIKPEVFIIENVKNIISTENGYFLQQIIEETQKMGYNINYSILNAANFGVPEKRERAIFIASLSKNILPPQELNIPKMTIKDAISDLAYLNSGEGSIISEYINPPQSSYQEMLRNPDGKLYNHIATKHKDIALKKLALIPPEGDKSALPPELLGNQKFDITWSRLKWDMQSPTIDTRFDTPADGQTSHPFLNRAITPREAARIQSFPDKYFFLGKKKEVTKQIGNAVPPLLAKAIGEQILKSYMNE